MEYRIRKEGDYFEFFLSPSSLGSSSIFIKGSVYGRHDHYAIEISLSSRGIIPEKPAYIEEN